MIPVDAPTAACADDLDLVDRAFRSVTSPEAEKLKRLCRDCPIAKDCLVEGMSRHEDGIWGRTTPNWRTHHGAPGTATTEWRRRVA